MDQNTVDRIVARVKHGQRVSFRQGFYGNVSLVLRSGPFGLFRTSYAVNPSEAQEIRDALKNHRRDASHA